MIKKLEAKHSIMVYNDNGVTVSVAYDKVADQWQNARAVSAKELREIADDDDRDECTPCGFLPTNMLWYVENKIMVWYCPPSIRPITVKKKKHMYRHPGLVFLVRRQNKTDKLSLAVVSKNKDERPDMFTKLYELPYRAVDVHPSGGVMGACAVIKPNPEFAYQLDCAEWINWQDAFFESAFNYQPTPRNRLKQKETELYDWITAHANKKH